MARISTAVLVLGFPFIVFAQTPSPSDPGSASTPHQRAVTGSGDQASLPANGGGNPSDASSPHQRDALLAPGAKISAADFVTKAGMDGMTEVQVAQLAVQKTQNDSVKKFAQQMITDHTKANTELMGIASNKHLIAPTTLDAEHQMVVQGLNDKSSAIFDTAYIRQMVMAHDKAIALFTSAKASEDSDIAAFATKTLPTLQMHKQMLTTMQSTARSANESM